MADYSPIAGANSPCDGPVNRVSVSEDFATIRAGSGNQGGLESVSGDTCAGLTATSTTDLYSELRRAGFNFDTSAITDGDTITSATFRIYLTFKTNGLGSTSLEVVDFTPASTASIPNTEFSNFGSTSFGSLAYASATTGAYNDITLDSNGIANISKTGISSFGLRLGWDVTGTFGGAWASSASTRYEGNFADSSNDPILVVTTSAGSTLFFGVIGGGILPFNV